MTDLPYRWRPLGTQPQWDVPEPGRVVAIDHAAWRIIEVRPVPVTELDDDERAISATHRPSYVIVRPARITGTDPRDRDKDRHLKAPVSCQWDVYPDDHYPVCVRCGQPVPCREIMAVRETATAAKAADSFSLPGVCPACCEPPTVRQKAVTFEVNLRVPLGPPVTFHSGRRECRYEASKYEKELAAADPAYVRILTCPGTAIRHYEEVECTEGPLCLGLKTEHDKVLTCDPDKCTRCRDWLAARDDRIRERNAAGDWTVW